MTFLRSLVTTFAICPTVTLLGFALWQAVTQGGLVLEPQPLREVANWATTTGMIVWLSCVLAVAVPPFVGDFKRSAGLGQ